MSLFRAAIFLVLVSVCVPVAKAGKFVADIEYGNLGGERLLLDACVPEGEGPFPMLILIHGGGWGSGDKAQDFDVLRKPLTEAGFTWFSINYRLAPQHRWPACFEDVQAAIRWVRMHAADYKGDPERIALIGYSAGGQLATLAAIRADESTKVQALVGLAPALEMVEDTKRRGQVSVAVRNLLDLPETLDDATLARIEMISPAEEVKPGLPPVLLVQGTADKSVRHVDTVAFSERLKQAKVSCELIEIKDAPHRIAEWDKFSPEYPAKVVAWLKITIGSGFR